MGNFQVNIRKKLNELPDSKNNPSRAGKGVPIGELAKDRVCAKIAIQRRLARNKIFKKPLYIRII